MTVSSLAPHEAARRSDAAGIANAAVEVEVEGGGKGGEQLVPMIARGERGERVDPGWQW